MSPELTVTNQGHYAALALRFRAFRNDLFLCLGVFLIGSVVAGILFENHPSGSTAVFILILAFVPGSSLSWSLATAAHSVTEKPTSEYAVHGQMPTYLSGER